MPQVTQRTKLVLADDQVVQLDGVPVNHLLGSGARAQRFVDVVGGDARRVLVRRSKRLTVGRFSVGTYDIVVAPPFNPSVFVQFLLYALRIDLSRYASEVTSGVNVESSRGDIFLVLMAALLVAEVEGLLHGHVSKSYVRADRRVGNLQGRIRWERNFGRHPAVGWECTVHEQVTDDPLNQLILAGLSAAVELLSGTEQSSGATTQLSIWRQLASMTIPSPADFENAARRVSRLTEHYRPALALARALTLGLAPADLVSDGVTGLNNLEFSLPSLYENFLMRLLTPCAARLGLELDFKHRYFEALTDADGAPYRRVEPDIVVLKGGRPVGVVDAKFKPRYVNPAPANVALPEAQVTNEDIYQLFFYQSRLQSLGKLQQLPRAVILAPLFGGQASSSIAKRTVMWSDRGSGGIDAPSLRVVPVPIEEALEQLKCDREYAVAVRCMPEAVAELVAMAAT